MNGFDSLPTLANRYQLIEYKTSVPFETWLATDTILQKEVRLVVFRQDNLEDILDAARRASLITDSRFVKIRDIFTADIPVHNQTNTNTPAAIIVTNPVSSYTLQDIISAGGHAQIKTIIGECAGALEIAHKQGVRHLALSAALVYINENSISLDGLGFIAVAKNLLPDTTSPFELALLDTKAIVELYENAKLPESPHLLPAPILSIGQIIALLAPWPHLNGKEIISWLRGIKRLQQSNVRSKNNDINKESSFTLATDLENTNLSFDALLSEAITESTSSIDETTTIAIVRQNDIRAAHLDNISPYPELGNPGSIWAVSEAALQARKACEAKNDSLATPIKFTAIRSIPLVTNTTDNNDHKYMSDDVLSKQKTEDIDDDCVLEQTDSKNSARPKDTISSDKTLSESNKDNKNNKELSFSSLIENANEVVSKSTQQATQTFVTTSSVIGKTLAKPANKIVTWFRAPSDQEQNTRRNPVPLVFGFCVIFLVLCLIWAILALRSPLKALKSPPASAIPSASSFTKNLPVVEGPVVKSLKLVHPSGYEEQDNPQDLPNMLDGQANTFWSSESYDANSSRAGKFAIIITLEKSTLVKSIALESNTPGGQIRWLQYNKEDISTGKVLAQTSFTPYTSLEDLNGITTDTIVLWIESLPIDANHKLQLRVSQIYVK